MKGFKHGNVLIFLTFQKDWFYFYVGLDRKRAIVAIVKKLCLIWQEGRGDLAEGDGKAEEKKANSR